MKNLSFTIFPLLGVLFTAISRPFILGKVAPNSWSGVRTPKTLSDPDIWYAANRVMGYDLLIAGVVIFIVSIAVLILSRSYPGLPTTRVNVIVLLCSLGGVALHTFWALSRM